AGATKVPVPRAAGGKVQASVAAVGALSDGVTLHRLYLDERSVFQLHLDKSGRPDECRYFGRIDEVRPADDAEWGFWLDPDNGVIGWPVFETKDGKSYTRVWAGSDARVPPRRFTERLQDAQGVRTRRIEAMLYAAPLGRPPPAPQTEYILVAMVEA